jgi:hypothetical protein
VENWAIICCISKPSRISRSICIDANAVSRSWPRVLRNHVFVCLRVENDLSADADETGATRKICSSFPVWIVAHYYYFSKIKVIDLTVSPCNVINQIVTVMPTSQSGNGEVRPPEITNPIACMLPLKPKTCWCLLKGPSLKCGKMHRGGRSHRPVKSY